MQDSIKSEELLYFKEYNIDQIESIIFLHGAGGSHIEWKAIASQKSVGAYHLILIDLPGHSGSRDIGPFSLEAAAYCVAKVLREHAHGGKSHVVGFSLGGFVAMVLAARHPDVVLSTFVTGAYPYTGLFKWAMARPTIMRMINSFESLPGLASISMCMQGIDDDEWLDEMRRNKSWDRTGATMRELSNFGMDRVQAVANSGVRTCVVAGGKMDQVGAVKEMGSALTKGGQHKNAQCKAAVVQHAYHPWHLQLPTLFAAGVDAWVRGQELPSGFDVL